MNNSKYSVFDNLIEGVQVINRKWQYFYVNDAIAKHGKSTKEALLGKTMREKYPGIEHTDVFRHISKCMEDKIPYQLINEFQFPDGSLGWFELSIQSVSEGVLVLSSDITKQKEVEMKLAEKLNERNRMIAQITEQKKQLEDFCQIIAHNLRAPLSNLLLLSDMIKESKTLKEKQLYLDKQKPIIVFLHEMFEELVEALQVRMDSLIKLNQINLEKCTKRAIALLQGEVLKSGAVITSDFSKANTITYPKKYIDSIIFNLLSNAIKFRSPERTPTINIRSYKKDGYTYLQVKDNGLGIDLKKYGDKLFKLRKTFHNHPDAKGFGLFITKAQVEAMKGKIIAKSDPGKGSTFTIKLYKNK